MQEATAETSTNKPSSTTLLTALRENAIQHKDKTFVQWANDKCVIVDSLTRGELWEQAGRVMVLLRKNGVSQGDRVMIAYPFGLAFLPGLIGCVRMGAIPCSVYPPNPRNAKHSYAQFNQQVEDAGAHFALTSKSFKKTMTLFALKGHKASVQWLATDHLSETIGTDDMFPAKESDLAFIQYSSGSTSAPKGVMISHAAIVHNLEYCRRNVRMHLGSFTPKTVTWCPQYHDFALVAAFLLNAFDPSTSLVAFSPLDFIKNPLLWADMLDKFQGNVTNGPNFSFALLAKRMKGANNRKLQSKVKLACIAAEPIAALTLQDMQHMGIPTHAISPAYGMAECCAYACAITGDQVQVLDDKVSCGLIDDFLEKSGVKICIANRETRQVLEDGIEGEIMLTTPSLAIGYWQNRDASQAFAALSHNGEDYFATGDIGKIVDNRLYVCGRYKELIIINGKNIYPTDLERTIESEYPTIVRPGSTVVFQDSSTTAGVVFEIRRGQEGDLGNVVSSSSICSILQESHGVEISMVWMLKQGSVPKTTSGKLRRVETKDRSVHSTWSHDTILLVKGQNHESDRKTIDTEESTPMDFDTIMISILGDNYVQDASWEANGLSSMSSVQLHDRLQDSFAVILPVDYLEKYSTPRELQTFVETHKNRGAFDVSLPPIPRASSMSLSWACLGILQGIGIVLLLLLFSASIIPAWYFQKWLIHDATVDVFNSGMRWFKWIWIPAVVPVFILSLSVCTIATKWIVVGRYKQQSIPVYSVAFLSWWFVDRAVSMWEFFAARFMLNSILLNIFYILLGANIHYSVKVKAFVREFDLVIIDRGSKVNCGIRCTRFCKWISDENFVMDLRKTAIGKNVVVDGLVGIGSVVRDSVCVDHCSALTPGSIVPSNVIAKGSPAFNAGHFDVRKSAQLSWLGESLKILWLLVEVYNFAALLLLGQVVWNDRIPSDWRYGKLCYWFLYILTTAIAVLVQTIPLKWILIGRRTPGKENESPLRGVCLWAVDYHFSVAVYVIMSVIITSSTIWQVFFKLVGMDIDFASEIDPSNFPPSMVDLVSIRRCFLSNISIDVAQDGILRKTTLKESNFGFGTHITAGAAVSRRVVPPMSVVDANDVVDNREIDRRLGTPDILEKLWSELLFVFLYGFLVALIFVSFIPAYEFWRAMSPDTIELAVPVLAVALALTTVVWMFLFAIVQQVTFGRHPARSKRHVARPSISFVLYFTTCWTLQVWTFFSLLNGTPFFGMAAKHLFGSRVHGRVLFLGQRVYDWSYLDFADKTVIEDSSQVLGHSLVFGEMTHGPTKVAGIVRPKTWVSVGADLSDDYGESSSMRFVLDVDSARKTLREKSRTKPLSEASEHSMEDDSPV